MQILKNIVGLFKGKNKERESLTYDFSPKCEKCGFPLDVIKLSCGFGDPVVYECKRCQCTFTFGEMKFIDSSGKEVNFNSYSLERFLKAQEGIYTSALTEVRNGLKVTHWIWFVFPQLKGLGKSETSCYFGIEDIEEARAYLKHPVLGVRLREITTALLNLNRVNPDDVFGRLDAMKVLSCMTLFNEVAEDDLFAKVMDKYYHGKRDEKTLGLINCELLLGAIAGAMAKYVFFPYDVAFDPFLGYTDTIVMTVANAEWLLTGNDLVSIMQNYGHRYLNDGYCGMFYNWLYPSRPNRYIFLGVDSAVYVSPIGWAFETLEETLDAAKKSAEIIANLPENIEGAQATAACVYLARKGKSKKEIKEYIESVFRYDLNRSCEEISNPYAKSYQGIVPECIIAFLESTDFESAISLSTSLWGRNTHKMGAITGGIAEAFYGGVPDRISREVLKQLPEQFIDVMQKFHQVFV